MTLAFAIIASKVSQYSSGGHPHSPVALNFTDAQHGGGVSSTLEHIWHGQIIPAYIVLIDLCLFNVYSCYFILSRQYLY